MFRSLRGPAGAVALAFVLTGCLPARPLVIQAIEVPLGAAAPETGHSFEWPLVPSRVLSYYGAQRRSHRHTGLDIDGNHGDPVRASRAGHVVYSGSGMRGYGKTVIIDHGNEFKSLYAHNSSLLVREGQRVRRGQTIARVGRTGNASGTHCHFEIRKNDVPVDPLYYLAPARSEMSR